MGNGQSSRSNSRFASASRAFTEKELLDLKLLFRSLAAQSNSSGEYISRSVFESYFGLRGALGERLFHLITEQRQDQKLGFEDLVIAKATYEKGTKDEVEEFIYQLAGLSGKGVVKRSDLESVLVAIFGELFSSTNEPTSTSIQDMVPIFVTAATFSKVDGGCNYEDFRKWCTLVPSIRKFLGSLLVPPNVGRSGSQVPRLLHENVDPNMTLLRKEYAWHIGGGLAQHEMVEWKLIYHSAVHGLSFNTFLGSLNDVGPTVLIIKDKDGYIYGGYASQPWERHGDFYGDMRSFLFQLYPKASLFRPTGANTNLQWCAVNFSSADVPNGIGFGGRVNHFGLFLSASFDQGHTFSCTTYGSPCLSKTNQIAPEVIECWRVFPKGAKESQGTAKGTVLERFKEDRHMLGMVGLANSSE